MAERAHGGTCFMCQPPEELPVDQLRRHLRLYHPDVAGPITLPDGTIDASVEVWETAPDHVPEDWS